MLLPGNVTLACARWQGVLCHRRVSVWRPVSLPQETSRFPTGRRRMDEVTFHREPPSNLPTMVVGFGGWIDAGEAATGALRYLVRQLGAAPLAAIDPEDFCDFTQIRPVVRLTTEGERTIRWPRS